MAAKKSFSILVFLIPLSLLAATIAGVFVYKSMLAPSRAAEEKPVPIPVVKKEQIRLPSIATKRPMSAFISTSSAQPQQSASAAGLTAGTPASSSGIPEVDEFIRIQAQDIQTDFGSIDQQVNGL